MLLFSGCSFTWMKGKMWILLRCLYFSGTSTLLLKASKSWARNTPAARKKRFNMLSRREPAKPSRGTVITVAAITTPTMA